MNKREKQRLINFFKGTANVILFVFGMCLACVVGIIQFFIIFPKWLFSDKPYSYYWETDFMEYMNEWFDYPHEKPIKFTLIK